jgi:hypothetical protein
VPSLEMPPVALATPFAEFMGYRIDPPDGGSIGEVCAVDEPECG